MHLNVDTSLIGRTAELQVLCDTLDFSASHDRCLLLVGEPGIGKSALLSVVRDGARDAGALVLSARGIEAERHVSFAGLHQLLSPLLADRDALPDVQRVAVEVALGLVAGPTPQMFLVALAAWGLVTRAAADRDVVILVDNLNEVDLVSQAVLALLTRRLADERVALVTAARSGYDGALADLDGVLELRRLTSDEAEQLLRRSGLAVDTPASKSVLDGAGGNPLALHELPKVTTSPRFGHLAGAGTSPLTPRLERAFGGPFRLLPPATRDAVMVAAAAADTDLQVVLAAASLVFEAPVTLVDLEPAVVTGLVRVLGRRLEFAHQLARSAVLTSASPGRVLSAHAALGASVTGDRLASTWHRANATLSADAVLAAGLEGVVPIAVSRGVTELAVRCLERAAELTTDPRLRGRRYLSAAVHSLGLGQPWLTAGLRCEAAEAPAFAQLDLIQMDWVRILEDGEPADAHALRRLGELAGDALALDDPDLALDLLLAATTCCWWSDPGAEVRAELYERVLAHPDTTQARFWVALAALDPVRALVLVGERLTTRPATSDTDTQDSRLMGLAAYAVGDSARAAAHLGRAEAELRHHGAVGQLFQVLLVQISVRLGTGDWPGAQAAIEEARGLSRQTYQPLWDAALLIGRAHRAALRGDLTDALELAGQAELTATQRAATSLLAGVRLAKGCAWASVGRFAEAYAELQGLFERAEPLRQPYPAVMFFAEAAVHAGHRREAKMIIERSARSVETPLAPDLLVHLRYAEAALADDDRAEGLYRAALDSDLHQWPFVRAMLQASFGAWLRRHRRIAESRLPTRSALITFDSIGARGWAARARSELAAAGERWESPARPPQSVLSPQQLKIAQLAARGLSNREIGEQLFLSPRTVGSHLYRIFPKLGVTSRIHLVHHLNQLDA